MASQLALNSHYTQWEFFLAKQYGKHTYVFFTGADFKPDEPNSENTDFTACQTAYRQWIKTTGEHREPLTTSEKLIEDVLVLPFPDLSRPKPITLPYHSLGTLFKGRDEFLQQLRESLRRASDGRATAIVVKALHGLGGVGKSRLALEYAWQQEKEYTALLFVIADSPENLHHNLATLCGPRVLDLPEQHATEEEVQLAAALRWLRKHSGWFLILDNVDTHAAAEAAEKLLAELHGGYVLLTSRLANWSGCVEALELDVLTEQAAVDFLLERTAKRRKMPDDAAQARTLAVELGQLALALEQAGAYIATKRITFTDYLKKWYAQRDQVLAWFDERLMQYPCSVAVTWQTSFDQLSEAARLLLHRLAWFDPAPIPESVLEVPIPDAVETATDPLDALADLAAYSLVTHAAETPTFTIHRLVQDVTRRNLRGDTDHRALNEALRWIDEAFAGDPTDVRSWPTLDPLAPHARAVAQHADKSGIADPTARLMNQLGVLLKTKAQHADAESLMRRVLAIGEQSFGLNHPNVATALNNLAQLLKDTNRLAEAEPLLRRALAIDETSFGPDHPNVARNLNNLARLLQDTNRLADAEPLFRRALTIDETSFGPNHPTVATDLNNLALLLKDTNRLADAEPLFRRALAIDETSFGHDHPKVARDLNNLAGLLQDTNRLADAEPLFRRALAIDEQSFGPNHPNIAIRLNNLATLLQATNRLADAEPLFRRALAIDEHSFDPNHPKVAIDLNNLATLLQDTNRLADAELLSRRTVGIFLDFTHRTGHEHPHLRQALKNYAGVLQGLGKTETEIATTIRQLRQEHGLPDDNPP